MTTQNSSGSNSLLTAPKRYFCDGSSILHVVLSACLSSLTVWSSEEQLILISVSFVI